MGSWAHLVCQRITSSSSRTQRRVAIIWTSNPNEVWAIRHDGIMYPFYFGHMRALKWICFSASYAYPWQEAMKAFWLLRTPCFISTIHILIVDQLQSLNYGTREHPMSKVIHRKCVCAFYSLRIHLGIHKMNIQKAHQRVFMYTIPDTILV